MLNNVSHKFLPLPDGKNTKFSTHLLTTCASNHWTPHFTVSKCISNMMLEINSVCIEVKQNTFKLLANSL